MKNHETVRPMTKGQKADLVKTFSESIPETSFEDADAVLANKGPLVAEIRSAFEKYMPSSLANRQIAMWRKIYKTHFGIIKLDPVQIPTHRKGFDRLIVVAQGVTIQQAYDTCKKLFPCWKSTERNLDEVIPTNDRMPTAGAYAIWVRDRIEADEELKNLSANNLAAKSITMETVLERELHEIVYFIDTGKHLDIKNITLLAGSRSAYGSVPHAYWDGDEFYVRVAWCSPDDADDHLRARQVVS